MTCLSIQKFKSNETEGILFAFWQNHANLWKSILQFFTKLEIVLLEDPVISLLSIYPKDVLPYHNGIYSSIFISALFVIARNWKEPRCPSPEEWIKKIWIIHTAEYCSTIIKWHHKFCRQMDETRKYPEWGNP